MIGTNKRFIHESYLKDFEHAEEKKIKRNLRPKVNAPCDKQHSNMTIDTIKCTVNIQFLRKKNSKDL